MLTRNCVKFTSYTRVLLVRSNLTNRKNIFIPCTFNLDIKSSRLLYKAIKLNISSASCSHDAKNIETPQTSNLTLSNEDLLEKHIAILSRDIHQKNRVYKNDLLRVISKVKDLNFSSKKQSLLLIRCCTELLPDETAATRMSLLELVWDTLKSHTTFKVEHYNELLQVYIANNRTLTARSFIQQMAPIKPDITTYELMIQALSEVGDWNQATEVISNMKAQNLPATDKIFNSLIICQGKAGNLKNIEEVLSMMKSLKLDYSVDTCTAVVRALIWNEKTHLIAEEMEKALRLGLHFNERNVMEIVKTLAEMGVYDNIPRVLQFLPQETRSTPSISPYLQSVCTLLVYQNHPMAALEIYKCLPLPSFGPKDDQGLHGRSLVRDCVKASMPSTVIALITQNLMSTGRNPIALQNASEAALQLKKVPLALDLFVRMKQLGLPIRPHYFWPILLNSSKSYGEKGIMNALTSMVSMDVKPDYETILNYTLPFVSFTSPQNLMKKFQATGLTISAVLTPMMEVLLNTGQVRAASELCELFEGKVNVEKIIKPLVKGYLLSLDRKSAVYLLEDATKKAINKHSDWVGRFLCALIQSNKTMDYTNDFLNIVKMLKDTPLKISTSSVDYCLSKMPENESKDKLQEIKDCLIAITDDNLIDDSEAHQNVMHPKLMNEEALRNHLIELEAKGMNTRGVLRKLLQQYCRDGNLPAAKEMLDKCLCEGVFISGGMKASIFDLHVKLGEIEQAELALADLNKTSPNFSLDEYKIIDFATLLVYQQKIDKACEIIKEQAKKRRIMGGRGVSINCWRLLNATAAHGTPAQVRHVFELLTSFRFCQPTNVILGPLVRVHLKNNEIEEAVNEYVRISNKYKRTPLKHELLCHIVYTMGEGKEENFLVTEKSNGRLNRMAQTILDMDRKIHGPGSVQITMIAVLAEVGYKKTLRKLLLDPTVKFHPEALLRRCERFADEKKARALQTIAECARDVRHVDVVDIYDLALDVYQVNNDCQEALNLWSSMQEGDVSPSQKFIRNMCMLFKANNQPIPPELSVLLDKEAKVNK